jgi:hypothetical protein
MARIVRQRKFSYSFESEFTLSIRGYMTCHILRRSLLRLSTARDSSFLMMMMTTTTTSFECSHVNSHETMIAPAHVLVLRYSTYVTRDITVIGTEPAISVIKARRHAGNNQSSCCTDMKHGGACRTAASFKVSLLYRSNSSSGLYL